MPRSDCASSASDVGLALVEIADRREAQVVVLGAGQFGQAGEVAPSHAAASDDRNAQKIRHASVLRLSRESFECRSRRTLKLMPTIGTPNAAQRA